MGRSVSIIGAGVIGLTLAKDLALRGIEVTVYDSKRNVSEGAGKASGIFSVAGLERSGIPYRKGLVNTLNGAVLWAGKESLRIKSKDTKAYVVDRAILADLCKSDAESAGAKVVLGKRMDRDRLLEMAADKDNILVGADGAVSTVASVFGFPSAKEHILTYKAEYDSANIEDRHMVGLYFSNKIAYRFFGWSCPYTDDRIELGIGISSRAKITSTVAFKKFMASGMVDGIIGGARQANGFASIIPLSARARTVKGNVALVGDAAGQVKATTGGGIIFGALCAKTLANVIEKNVKSGASLEAYEKEWRKRYTMDLKMHSVLHSYYSTFSGKSLETFFRASKLLGAEGFFSKYGDMDRPSLMIKRFFLRGLTE
ncbi:MAG: NAD(P)/FAD-dependent oxidoreductase [Candidatus Micrarchaeota archaeon]|nr:NAD(P)/FAD-dependent oxidoreductase [Candidatus Micrarchaeota archaeon]